MPLKGYLSIFNTTQLLNLINLSKRTGSLNIYEGVKTGEKLTLGDGETKIDRLDRGKMLANLSFQEGKLVYAEMDGKDGHLASVLHRAGKLNEEQAKLIRSRAEARGMSDKGLALSLINANYVTRKDIVGSVQKHIVSIVFDLVTWKSEPFEFMEGHPAPDERILVPVDLKPVIIQAAMIEAEKDKLEDEIPNLDWSLKFTEDQSTLKDVKLSPSDWRVIGFINPKNSIRQIAKACNMTDTEIRRVIYRFMQAGLVQLVKPQVTKTLKPPSSADRDVVNRLIHKLKNIKASP